VNKAAQPHYCKLDTKMPGKKSSSTAGKKTGGKSKSNAATAVVSQAAQSALVRAAVPQWFRIDPDQIQGAAGGFVWKISDREQVIRYLIIGSEGGNYYQTPQQVSSTCASCILRMTRTPDNFKWLCETISQVSTEGRAAKQESTLIALATIIVFAPTMEAKKQALDIVKDCVRIPTHLYMVTGYVKLFSKAGHPNLITAAGSGFGSGIRRVFGDLITAATGGQTKQQQQQPQQPVTGSGFGRGIRRVFGDYFYTRKGSEIAMLMTKYQNREGWRIKDVLTLVHIDQKKMKDDEGRLAIDWVFKPKEEFDAILKTAPPSPTAALFNAIKEISSMVESPTFRSSQEELDRIVHLINATGLCREHLPSQLFKQRRIWEALLMSKGVNGKGKGMPLTALIRNLGKLSTSEIGIIEARTTRDTHPNAKLAYAGARPADAAAAGTPQVFPAGHSQHYTEYIYRRLTNARDIKFARIHPYNVLVAMMTYKKGCGDKGGLTWPPNIYILEALDIAFKLAFQNITPTGKRIKIALDVSGSMSSAFCTGSPIVNCATGSVAMMMMTLWVENQHRLKLATSTTPEASASNSTTATASTAAASQHLAEVMKWKITQLPDGRTLYEHAETKQCQFNKPEILSAPQPQPQQQPPKAAGGAAAGGAAATSRAPPTIGEYKATKRYLGIPEEAPKQPERQGQFGYSSYYSTPSYTPSNVYLPESYPAPAIPSNVTICAFSNTLTELTNAIVGYMDASINPETGLPMMSIDDALKLVEMPFSSTDCALPMVRALEKREPVDAFVIYTDSETYMGKIHPQVALEEYRRGMGIDAKLIVVGMTSNCLTIADPNDLNTLNLAGFDTATPRIINDFIAGTLLPTPAPKPSPKSAAGGGGSAAAGGAENSGQGHDDNDNDEDFVLLD
jgi:60 kDa SS-A/Ro ribonucleoprotein